jgi:hypothetical protein
MKKNGSKRTLTYLENASKRDKDAFALGFFRSRTDSAPRDRHSYRHRSESETNQMLHKRYDHPTNRYIAKINLMRASRTVRTLP